MDHSAAPCAGVWAEAAGLGGRQRAAAAPRHIHVFCTQTQSKATGGGVELVAEA